MYNIIDQENNCIECNKRWHYTFLTITSFNPEINTFNIPGILESSFDEDVRDVYHLGSLIRKNAEIISTHIEDFIVMGSHLFFVVNEEDVFNFENNELYSNLSEIQGVQFKQSNSFFRPNVFCGTGNAWIFTHFSVSQNNYRENTLGVLQSLEMELELQPGDNFEALDDNLADQVESFLKVKLFDSMGYKTMMSITKIDNVIHIACRKEIYELLVHEFDFFDNNTLVETSENISIYPQRLRWYEIKPGETNWLPLIFSNVKSTSIRFLGFDVSGFDPIDRDFVYATEKFINRFYYLKEVSTSTSNDKLFVKTDAIHPIRRGNQIKIYADADIFPFGGINNENISHLLFDKLLSMKVNNLEFLDEERREEEERCRQVLLRNGIDIANVSILSGIFIGDTQLYPAKIEDPSYNFNISGAGILSGGELPAKYVSDTSNTLYIENFSDDPTITPITFNPDRAQNLIVNEPYINNKGSANEGHFSLMKAKNDHNLPANWKTFHTTNDGIEIKNGGFVWGGTYFQPVGYVSSRIFAGDATGISFLASMPNLEHFPDYPLRWEYENNDNHQADGFISALNAHFLEEGVLNLIFAERVGDVIEIFLHPLLYQNNNIFNRRWNLTGLLGLELSPASLYFELTQEERFGELVIDLPSKYKTSADICKYIDRCIDGNICNSNCEEVFLDVRFLNEIEEEDASKENDEDACKRIERYRRSGSISDNNTDTEFFDITVDGRTEIEEKGFQICYEKYRAYLTLSNTGIIKSFWKKPSTYPLCSNTFSYCPINFEDHPLMNYKLYGALKANLIENNEFHLFGNISLNENENIVISISPTLFYQHFGIELFNWEGSDEYPNERTSNSSNIFQMVRYEGDELKNISREESRLILSEKLRFCFNLFNPPIDLGWCGIEYDCNFEYYFGYISFKDYDRVEEIYSYPQYLNEAKALNSIWSFEDTGIDINQIEYKNAGRHIFIWIKKDILEKSKISPDRTFIFNDPSNILLIKETKFIPYILRYGNDPYLRTEFSVSKKVYNHSRPIEAGFQEWDFEIPPTESEDNPYEQDDQVAEIIEQNYIRKFEDIGYDNFVIVSRNQNIISIDVDRLAYPFLLYDYPEFENSNTLIKRGPILISKDYYHFSPLRDHYSRWFTFEKIPDEEAPKVFLNIDINQNDINLDEETSLLVLNNPDSNDWIITSNITEGFQESIGYGIQRYFNIHRRGNRMRFTLNADLLPFGLSAFETENWNPRFEIEGKIKINGIDYDGKNIIPFTFNPVDVYSNQEKHLEIPLRIVEFSSRATDDFYNLRIQLGGDRQNFILIPNIPLGPTKLETAEKIKEAIENEFPYCDITSEIKTRLDKSASKEESCVNLEFTNIFDPYVRDNVREVVSRFEPFLENIRPSNEGLLLGQVNIQIKNELGAQIDPETRDLVISEIRNNYASINDIELNRTSAKEEVYIILKIGPSYLQSKLNWNDGYRRNVNLRGSDNIIVSPQNISSSNLKLAYTRIFTAGRFKSAQPWTTTDFKFLNRKETPFQIVLPTLFTQSFDIWSETHPTDINQTAQNTSHEFEWNNPHYNKFFTESIGDKVHLWVEPLWYRVTFEKEVISSLTQFDYRFLFDGINGNIREKYYLNFSLEKLEREMEITTNLPEEGEELAWFISDDELKNEITDFFSLPSEWNDISKRANIKGYVDIYQSNEGRYNFKIYPSFIYGNIGSNKLPFKYFKSQIKRDETRIKEELGSCGTWIWNENECDDSLPEELLSLFRENEQESSLWKTAYFKLCRNNDTEDNITGTYNLTYRTNENRLINAYNFVKEFNERYGNKNIHARNISDLIIIYYKKSVYGNLDEININGSRHNVYSFERFYSMWKRFQIGVMNQDTNYERVGECSGVIYTTFSDKPIRWEKNPAPYLKEAIEKYAELRGFEDRLIVTITHNSILEIKIDPIINYLFGSNIEDEEIEISYFSQGFSTLQPNPSTEQSIKQKLKFKTYTPLKYRENFDFEEFGTVYIHSLNEIEKIFNQRRGFIVDGNDAFASIHASNYFYKESNRYDSWSNKFTINRQKSISLFNSPSFDNQMQENENGYIERYKTINNLSESISIENIKRNDITPERGKVPYFAYIKFIKGNIPSDQFYLKFNFNGGLNEYGDRMPSIETSLIESNENLPSVIASILNFHYSFIEEYENWSVKIVANDMIKIYSDVSFLEYPKLEIEIEDVNVDNINIENDVIINSEICYTVRRDNCFFSRINKPLSELILSNNLRRVGERLRIFDNGIDKLDFETSIPIGGGVSKNNLTYWGRIDVCFDDFEIKYEKACLYLGIFPSDIDLNFLNCVQINITAWDEAGTPIDEREVIPCAKKAISSENNFLKVNYSIYPTDTHKTVRSIAKSINESIWSDRLVAVAHGDWISFYFNPLYSYDWGEDVISTRLDIYSEFSSVYDIGGEKYGSENFSFPFKYQKAKLSVFPIETDSEDNSIGYIEIELPELLKSNGEYEKFKFEVSKSIYDTCRNIRDAINLKMAEKGLLETFFAHYYDGNHFVSILYLYKSTNRYLFTRSHITTKGKYKLYFENAINECQSVSNVCEKYELRLRFEGGFISSNYGSIFEQEWDSAALNEFDTYRTMPYNEGLNCDIYKFLKKISHDGNEPLSWVVNEDYLPQKVMIESFYETPDKVEVEYIPVFEERVEVIASNLNKGYELINEVDNGDFIQIINDNEVDDEVNKLNSDRLSWEYECLLNLNAYERQSMINIRFINRTTSKREHIFNFVKSSSELNWKIRFFKRLDSFIENMPYVISYKNGRIIIRTNITEVNFEVYVSTSLDKWKYLQRIKRYVSLLPLEEEAPVSDIRYRKNVMRLEIHDESVISNITINGIHYPYTGNIFSWIKRWKREMLKDAFILKYDANYTSKVTGEKCYYIELYSELKEESIDLHIEQNRYLRNAIWIEALKFTFTNIHDKLEIRINNTNYNLFYDNLYISINEKLSQWIEENDNFLYDNNLHVHLENETLTFYQNNIWVNDYEVDAGLFGNWEDETNSLQNISTKIWKSSIIKTDETIDEYTKYRFFAGSTLGIFPSHFNFNQGEYRILQINDNEIDIRYKGKLKAENDKLTGEQFRDIVVPSYFKYPTYGLSGEDIPAKTRLKWEIEEQSEFFLMEIDGVNSNRYGNEVDYIGDFPIYNASEIDLSLVNEPNTNPNWRALPEKQQTVYKELLYNMPFDNQYDDTIYSTAIPIYLGYNYREENAVNRNLIMEMVFDETIKLRVSTSINAITGEREYNNIFEITEDGRIKFHNVSFEFRGNKYESFVNAGVKEKMNIRIRARDFQPNDDFDFKNKNVTGTITEVGVSYIIISSDKELIKQDGWDIPEDHQIEIEIELLPIQVGYVSLWGESEGEDERFSLMLRNLGGGVDLKYKHAFYNYDTKETGNDWMFLNDKNKELFFMFDCIYNYVGSYKGLINSIGYFGWSDLEIDEFWKNEKNGDKVKTTIPASLKDRKFVEVKTQRPDKDYRKLPELAITYPATDYMGIWKDTDKSISEIQYQLSVLRKWLRQNMIPVGITSLSMGLKVGLYNDPHLIHSRHDNFTYNTTRESIYNNFYVKAYKILTSNDTYNIEISFRQKGVVEHLVVHIKTYRPVRDVNGNTEMQLIEKKLYYPKNYENINFTINAEINYAFEIEIINWSNPSAPYGRKETYKLQDIID